MAITLNAPSQVRPYATFSAFPATGAVKTIYIDEEFNKMYRWTGSAYVELSETDATTWGSITGDITSQNDLQLALDAKFDNPTGDSTQYLDGAGTPVTFPAFASADKMVTVGRNSTGSTLYKGTIVYISGSTGNRPNFVKAQANAEATSAGTFGVIEADIANNADGNCVTIGTIDNLDTRSSAPHPFTSDTLADGDTIYLSPTTAGFITNVKPYAPSHLVYLGKVVRTSSTNGTIVYRVQNGYELDELHDVAAQTPSDGQVLTFETATQLWKPKTIATGITIGTTAITSGTVGRVLFEGTGNVVQESANLFWDNTNVRLGVGIATPTNTLNVYTSVANYGLRLQSNSTGANLIGTEYLWDATQLGTFSVNGSSGEFKWFMKSGGFFPTIYSNGVERLRIATTGNVLINTTTDAGYKADINGTMRVVNTLTVSGTGTDIAIQFRSGRIDADNTWLRIKSAGNQDMVNLTANFLGINATAVIPSAIMAITSTDRGFLPPRMTTTQKNAIASPVAGLQVYDTTLNLMSVYNGTAWITL